jgi:Ca2+-binding RTX toxin-like protein
VRGVRRAAARSIGGLAVACVVLTIGVPAAHAGATYLPVVSDVGDALALGYTADPGANHLDVSIAGGAAVFTDVIPPAAPSDAPCSVELPLTCPMADVVNLAIDLGEGDDAVAVGGAGPPLVTTVDGGPGSDRADYSARGAATIALEGTAGGVAFRNVEGATGSEQADTITGSDQANNLAGLGGVDDIDGLAGVDDVDGGDGADHISGGDGNDILAGGAGRDALLGDAGDDQLAGGPEGDVLKGGPGQDTFDGGAGNDDILAADQVAETIDCGDDIGGGDIDTVAADLGPEGDLIGFDC